MINMPIENYKTFLKSIDILPLKKWKFIEIEHVAPPSNKKQKQMYKRLRDFSEIDNKPFNGLYLYERNDEIIYVGKGKPIYNRIKSHYRESFQEVSGDTKLKTWHKFFSKYSGFLKLYIIEIQEENDRKIIELMLQKIYDPTFESFREELESR